MTERKALRRIYRRMAKPDAFVAVTAGKLRRERKSAQAH